MGEGSVLDAANCVLDTFSKCLFGYVPVRGDRWRLYIYGSTVKAGKRLRMPANLDTNRQSLGGRYGRLGMGDTQAMATGQLIRWIRGMPRVPIRTWRYWETVELAGDRSDYMLSLLLDSSYADDNATHCVLCDKPPIGLDWWCLGRVSGPCCGLRHGELRQRSCRG